MIVRGFTDADRAEIERMHKLSGFDYSLHPDLSSKSFLSLRVIEKDGQVGMAAFLRRTAECFLIVDKGWQNPAWRNEALRKLHYACNADAKEAGIDDVVAFLPPKVALSFGKRLTKLGWSEHREGWKAYSIGVY